MGLARNRANHHSHCARVVLDAWAAADSQGAERQTVLADAFGLAVQVHLRSAYGWFLLELAQVASLDEPVDSADALRALPGAVWRAELSELAVLEADPQSWLGRLLQLRCRLESPPVQTPGMLAVAVDDTGYALATLRDYRQELERTMARMSLTLQEW